MHQHPILILLITFFPAAILVGDGYEPQPVSASDFSGLIKQSPFNRTLNLSDSLILTGFAKIDDQQVATLLDTKTKETYFVSATPNKQGWKMLEVNPNEDLERVTAKISLAGEVVNIRYAEVKIKPGETRPGGGTGRPEPSQGSSSQRKGPPDDIRKRIGSLSEDQRGKFFGKLKELREKHPDQSSDEHHDMVRKVLDKMSKKKK